MPAKSQLLITNAKDRHACAVDHVLRMLGGKPVIVNTATIPSGGPLGVTLADDKTHVQLGDYSGPSDQIGSVWVRRISKRFVMPEASDPADHKHLRDNCRTALHGILRLLDGNFPVNPLASKTVHSLKIMQLSAARAAGFRVPRTLVSNDYDAISAFIGAVPSVCVKSYYPQGWKSELGNIQAVTTVIDSMHDFERGSFEIMPHIYQEYIPKRAEHRLTIFGDYATSIMIDIAALKGQAQVDWRSDLSYLSHIRPSQLPDEVIAAAKSVMRSCGLRFGTFDIAETSDGEFVFFEVNEAGQWLWIETSCPEVRLLQPFCEFLIQADDNYRPGPIAANPALSAEVVLGQIDDNPRYRNLLACEFTDQSEYVADELRVPA